jgi:hypothetical protein
MTGRLLAFNAQEFAWSDRPSAAQRAEQVLLQERQVARIGCRALGVIFHYRKARVRSRFWSAVMKAMPSEVAVSAKRNRPVQARAAPSLGIDAETSRE